MDSNTGALNLDPDPEFWPNLDPDPGPNLDPGSCYLILKKKKTLKIILEKYRYRYNFFKKIIFFRTKRK